MFRSKSTPWGISKPRGWAGPLKRGDTVLWSCRGRDRFGDRCMAILRPWDAVRARNKGDFVEVEAPS